MTTGKYINANELRHLVLYFADASNLNGNHEKTKAYNHCLCMIDDRKPADVRPNVRGEWIYKNDNILIPTGYWECSVCKEGRLMHEENYCPNCGADMRKGEEE